MAKFRAIKNSFVGGEISRSVLGRTDIPQYPHACKQLRNMIPLVEGGAYRRPGTIYETQESSAFYRAPFFFPFKASDGTRYMLELTPGATGHTPQVRFYTGTTKTAPSTLGLAVNVTGGTSLPYTFEQLADAKTFQIGDVMWFVHPDVRPFQIRRTDATHFALVDFYSFPTFDGTVPTPEQQRDGWPYAKQNVTATTITPSATTGGVTLTASAAAFVPGDVGTYWKFDHTTTIGCVWITGYTSATVVTGLVIRTLGGTTAVASWWPSAWSDAKGWPSSICAFEGRLLYGGTKAFPDSVWCSAFANYAKLSLATALNPNSDPAMTNTDPFTATLSASIIARITWMKAANENVLLGTEESEWTLGTVDTASGFGFNNYGATHQSDYGSTGVFAASANDVFVVSKDGTKVRAFNYSWVESSYVAEEVQVLYPEFPYLNEYAPLDTAKRNIKQLVWDDARSTLWCLDGAGNLRGMTRNKKLGVTAWHSHQLGGFDALVSPGTPYTSGLDGTNPSEYLPNGSIMTIGGLENDVTKLPDLWMSVRRKVGVTWCYFVERMPGMQVTSNTNRQHVLGYQGVWTDATKFFAVDTSTGWDLPHLAGMTISGVADKPAAGMWPLTPATGGNGSPTLTPAAVGADQLVGWPTGAPNAGATAYHVAFGLNFTPIVEPVTQNSGSVTGVAVGGVQRPTKAMVRFTRTMRTLIGQTAAKLYAHDFAVAGTPVNMSPEFFDGVKEASIDGSYTRDGLLVISQDKPLPMTVVSIVTEGLVYD
jgi:hypothetical protein